MGWYLTITEEMRAAGLAGNELLVFALIHGYSQQADGCYHGGQTIAAARCGITVKTLRYILTDLEERGFVRKFNFMDGGVLRCAYSTIRGWERQTGEKISPGEKFSLDRGKNFPTTGEKISPIKENTKENENKERVSISAPARGKFDFRQALLDLGVTPETADAWMEVRRRAKAVNSELAFKDVAAQIAKSGHSAEECIHKAAAKSWRGFEATWMEERQPAQQRPAPRQQGNYFEANARAVAEIERRYGFRQNTDCDEQ